MEQSASQRMGRKYYFNDPDMDLFFMSTQSFGPTGGLDIGQVFYVASTIKDGDADSWVQSFLRYAEYLNGEANRWSERGCKREAGETRLKAFASYRAAWQFAAPGAAFSEIVAKQRATFVIAMQELELPAQFFTAPYKGKQLPGVFFQAVDANAPVVLLIGGADTSFEDLFLSSGRNLLNRGYSVAMADLPGQGITQAEGLHWEVEAEKPIASVIDVLVDKFNAKAGRIALIGISLGGYFAARAAGHEQRLATVIASTPFPNPAQLFSMSVREGLAQKTPMTTSGLRNRQAMIWKAGAKSPEDFLERTKNMLADASIVTVPFLSICGGGDSKVFQSQAEQWHREIRSERKAYVFLDAATGADGHCQVNNRMRLTQECHAWLNEIFAR